MVETILIVGWSSFDEDMWSSFDEDITSARPKTAVPPLPFTGPLLLCLIDLHKIA